MGDFFRQRLGGFDPSLHDFFTRGLSGEFFLVVHFLEFCSQVCGVALCELGHAVHAGGFEQLGVLTCDALDSEEVGVVGKLQDLRCGEAGLCGEFVAAFRGCGLLQKVVGTGDTCVGELLFGGFADALDGGEFILGDLWFVGGKETGGEEDGEKSERFHTVISCH